MTDPTTATPPVETVAARVNRARTEAAIVVKAKDLRALIEPRIDDFIASDAASTVKRIDATWLASFSSIIASAERAIDGKPVQIEELRAATREERALAQTACDEIRSIRDRVGTSFPDDMPLRQAFGFGSNPDPRLTGEIIRMLGQIAEAQRNETFRANAIAVGITDERVTSLTTRRSRLSEADMGQHGVIRANADGVVTKDALVSVLTKMSTYALTVAKDVYRNQHDLLALFAGVKAPVARRKPARATVVKSAATKPAKPTTRRAATRKKAVRHKAKALTAPRATPAAKKKPVAKKKPAAKKKPVAKKQPAAKKRVSTPKKKRR